MPNPRFLVVSLGNQGPYFETLHSAGHFAIFAAQRVLGPTQPRFELQQYGKRVCKSSVAWPFMMMQCPTMMNSCGPWVRAAWAEVLKKHRLQPAELSLVLVHDDLESPPGSVKLRTWLSSGRGHNGVRSVKDNTDNVLAPKDRWARITVGIGRPTARDVGTVSDYVLRKLTPHQMESINNVAGPKVAELLRQLHDDWADS